MDQESPRRLDDIQEKRLHLLYSEAAEFARMFLEWRHKILSAYFLSSGGVLVMAKWFWESPLLRDYTFVPLILGAIFSIGLALMDHVNHGVLCTTYFVGRQLENRMQGEGLYSVLHGRFAESSSLSHYRVLRYWFFVSAAAFFTMALFVPFAKNHALQSGKSSVDAVRRVALSPGESSSQPSPAARAAVEDNR